MANITKKVGRGIEPSKRYAYWQVVTGSGFVDTNDDGDPIAQGDIFQIVNSLGHPAKYLYIETTSGTDLEIRINGQVTEYPLKDARLNWPVPGPDLENGVTRTDSSQTVLPVGAEEIWELDGILPICDIEIVSLSAGSFEIFVA